MELKANGVSFHLFNEKRCQLHSPVLSPSYHNQLIFFATDRQTVYISLFRWSHHVPIRTPTKDKQYVYLSALHQHYSLQPSHVRFLQHGSLALTFYSILFSVSSISIRIRTCFHSVPRQTLLQVMQNINFVHRLPFKKSSHVIKYCTCHESDKPKAHNMSTPILRCKKQ